MAFGTSQPTVCANHASSKRSQDAKEFCAPSLLKGKGGLQCSGQATQLFLLELPVKFKSCLQSSHCIFRTGFCLFPVSCLSPWSDHGT